MRVVAMVDSMVASMVVKLVEKMAVWRVAMMAV